MQKIYGIDLGTTNSLIGLGDKLLSGLVPSAANIDVRSAGAAAYDDPKARRSFKTGISMGVAGLGAVMASALVLFELRRIAGGDAVKDVVISVPAFFNDGQRAATRLAAEKAHLKVVHIINEPTAAAMWITRGKSDSVLFVYDLGGGTFDATAIDTRFMEGDVLATNGCLVGGDDLDFAIRDYLLNAAGLTLWRLSDEELLTILRKAERAKIQMQTERRDITVSLSEFGAGTVNFSEETYIRLMKRVFVQTIEVTKSVIHDALLEGEDWKFAFVGGSTRCPYLREWVLAEFKREAVKTDYDPDKVVAQGAALCAEYIAQGVYEEKVSDVCRRLSIGCVTGLLQELIPAQSKVPIESDEVLFVNAEDCGKLSLDLYEGNSELVSEANKIGSLVYDYGRAVKAGDGVVEVKALVRADGKVILKAREGMSDWCDIVIQR